MGGLPDPTIRTANRGGVLARIEILHVDRERVTAVGALVDENDESIDMDPPLLARVAGGRMRGTSSPHNFSLLKQL